MDKKLQTVRYFFEYENINLPIVVRRHPTSRRIVLRYQPLHQHLSLTIPRYGSIRQALRFVEDKRQWIMAQLNEHCGKMAMAHGLTLPVLGQRYTIHHIGGRGLVRIEGDTILIPGEERFLGRRIRDWLKKTARDEITKRANMHARTTEKKIKKISLRDTSSHWGSCSHDGALSFSWRLVFAPIEVLDYVVCHEVAHLSQHNHSPAFWSVVASLCPDYNQYRQWMKKHGQMLYSYR